MIFHALTVKLIFVDKRSTEQYKCGCNASENMNKALKEGVYRNINMNFSSSRVKSSTNLESGFDEKL